MNRFKRSGYANYTEIETSGIPLGLTGVGPAKLETFTLRQVLMALLENDMPCPPKEVQDKERWAKDALLNR